MMDSFWQGLEEGRAYMEKRLKKDIKSYTKKELEAELLAAGDKAFRAGQIYSWLHQKLAGSFDEMTNLSKELRERLSDAYHIDSLRQVQVQESKLDGTKKYLFELHDGHMIESVLMKYHHGNSVCISSQVGCRMGCRFCASTIDGMERNLTPAELLDQIYQIQKLTGERVSHIVVMGSGEPMDNYENIIKFIHMVSDKDGLHISQRNITVSTCGLVPQIKRLAEEGLQITLALSLHAPNDEIRKALMPIANAYQMDEVLDACRYYFDQTGRRITFEYSLVRGVNDSEAAAEELAERILHMNCHVNLIPVNPIKERNYKESQNKEILNFQNKLEKYGINVTIRREMGRDIDGACGQLRRSYREKQREMEGEACGHME